MAQNTDNPSKQEKPKFMRPSNDIVFKLLFADERNVSFLKSFLLSILDFPKEEYDTISIIDPHLLREHFDDKLGILDVKLKTSTGKIINIEVQVKSLDIMRERIAFYSSKLPSNYDGTMMWNWLKFLGARNEEELKMASEANPEIEKAAVRLEQLSADESARMLYEAREKELRDTRAAIREASEKSLAVGKAEGLAEGEKKLLSVALKTLEHWYANRRYH
ncbi:MAG: Rpn family recombination-promoting nuclease/putative transposase [Eubacteriaceae bacterium]|nr:Rpn family recombination-promoting nuclease/putative transposase [Eubacteriaceae bacterium]